MILRDYQKAAIASLYDHWAKSPESGAAIVIPTGGGKTPVMAQICIDAVAAGKRAMILAHRKELIQQTADRVEHTTRELGSPMNCGVYSASLGSRDTHSRITCGQIQSVYRHMEMFPKLDVLLIDEAHRIPPSGFGMYRQAIANAKKINPSLLVAGLTATPYRTGTGPLVAKGEILTTTVHESGLIDLIEQGYLCGLVTKQAVNDANTSGLHIRAGEFVKEEASDLMKNADRVAHAVFETIKRAEGRRSCLVFCVSIEHVEMVAAELRARCPADRVEMITGKTPSYDRDDIANDFKAGKVRWAINCEVWTEGFDAPNVDGIVLLRPTASPGLYYQMVGRGFRRCEGKPNCLVLDFGGNVMRHGPLGKIKPAKLNTAGLSSEPTVRVCPQCRTAGYSNEKICPECGYEFPAGDGRRINHDKKAFDGDILGGGPVTEWLSVHSVSYHVHRKNPATSDSPGLPTMRVEYICDGGRTVKEWVCFQHRGYAREKAVKWWLDRFPGTIVPNVTGYAVALMNDEDFGRKAPSFIKVAATRGEKFERIKAIKFGEESPSPVAARSAIAAATKDWRDSETGNGYIDWMKTPYDPITDGDLW
jgi:DNA repair protein RadD